jgi:hypothetical protein
MGNFIVVAQLNSAPCSGRCFAQIIRGHVSEAARSTSVVRYRILLTLSLINPQRALSGVVRSGLLVGQAKGAGEACEPLPVHRPRKVCFR